jgi:hypothetical protein
MRKSYEIYVHTTDDTSIPRVAQFLSPRLLWDPPPTAYLASECVLPPKGRGAGPNSDVWRKSLVLCILCGSTYEYMLSF